MRKEEKARLRSELKKRMRPGKTLVYFASGGRVREEYYSLPYDNVILVDYTFRDRQCTVRRCGGNVICIGLDALEAVWLFRTTGVKIDAFVAINEGLSEGGGRYVINSDIFLGYALPVLADPFIHIGMVEYYGGPNITTSEPTGLTSLIHKRECCLRMTLPISPQPSLHGIRGMPGRLR